MLRARPSTAGFCRKTNTFKKEARTHTHTSDCLRTVATMVTLKFHLSASAAKPPMLLYVRADKCAVVCWGTFVLPVALCPTSPSQTRPPPLHTEPLLSCIVVQVAEQGGISESVHAHKHTVGAQLCSPHVRGAVNDQETEPKAQIS